MRTKKIPLNLRKPKNSDRRIREHLTEHEIDKLIRATKKIGRHGNRDSTMILVAYRHGLRVSELLRLKWSQVDLYEGLLHVTRMKNGIKSTHPLAGTEIRALRKLKRDYPETDFLFVSERKAPLTDHTFRKILTRAGELAKLDNINVHPHMLRHSTGFKLANDGNDTRSIQLYLGHRSIQNTIRYTELSTERFKHFWPD
jgi:site-specific recombinase XerD